jgi:hypothetical protein
MPFMPATAAVVRIRPTLRRLGTLDPREVYRGQVFHDRLLWEGHSAGDVSTYRIDVHAADGTRLASAAVPHTLEFLHPFGPRTVIVVGKHYSHRGGWRTYHSIVRCVAAAGRPPRLTVKTRRMPKRLQVEQFGGGPDAMYFNEPGSRKVVRWNGWWSRPLEPDIHFPGTMIRCGRHLFVLERHDYRPGHETIARIDLVTQAIERTFPTSRQRITALVDVPGSPWIAATEAWADQVLLIDREANRLAATLPVPGMPVELAMFDRRLVVLAAESRTLMFFDLASAGLPLVAEWDLSGIGPGFEHPRAMHVDPESGSVFIRFAFHPLLEGSVAGVTLAVDPDRSQKAPSGSEGIRRGEPACPLPTGERSARWWWKRITLRPNAARHYRRG